MSEQKFNYNVKEEYARHIQAVGESIIKNADSIAGNEKYCYGIEIKEMVSPDEPTRIEVTRRFAPEGLIKNKYDA